MKPRRPSHRHQVAMEHHVCVLCDTPYATGSILMDLRFRRDPLNDHRMEPEGRLPEDPVTGIGVCDTCKRDFSGLSLEDYSHACLVECDPDKVVLNKHGRVDPKYPIIRTGKVGFVSRQVWDEIFNVPFPEEEICFVEPGVLEELNKIPGSEIVEVKEND